MEDFPAKIADLLESVAGRVRRMTVERVAGWARWTAIGCVLTLLGMLVAVFIVVAVFRLVAEWTTAEAAYGIFGGLFIVIGIVLWTRRLPRAGDSDVAETRE